MPTCPWCAAPLRPAAEYCAHCGQRLTPGSVPSLADGTLLQAGRYRLQQRLGVGGAGDVYLAQDTRLFNRAIVVKRLLVRTSDPQVRAAAEHNFTQEACALAVLNHTRIPRILDFFTDPPHLYLVMEYAPGDTLADYLSRQGGRLAAAAVAAMGAQVAAVLVYLHDQRPPIVHRDIKPANLILGPAGTVTLVDFGLARARPASGAPSDPAVSAVWGTLGYAPPEQLVGQAGPPADVYALGATLRELLTGAAPGEPIRGFTLPPPAPTAATLVERLIPLITGMMDPDPAARPPAPTLAAQLGALAAEFPTLLVAPVPPIPKAPAPEDQPTQRIAEDAPAVEPAAAIPTGGVPTPARPFARRTGVIIGGVLGVVAALGLSPLGPLLACRFGSALATVVVTAGWPLALTGMGLAALTWLPRPVPPTPPRLILTLLLGLGGGIELPVLILMLLQTIGMVQSGCP